MSIFKKLTILFSLSTILMIYIAIQINNIVNDNVQISYKNKYIQSSSELFGYLVNANNVKLEHRINELGYENNDNLLKYEYTKSEIIYEKKISFGFIKIIQNHGRLFLHMKYLNDEVVLFDTKQRHEFEQKKHFNYLILADIVLLLLVLTFILKMLKPLKNLSDAMSKFGAGDYTFRVKDSKSNDEISKVAHEFNKMAENLELQIKTRAQFLNDVSHELRMPIAKSKIALEMLEKSKYTKILSKSINQIDNLTNELLELQRLESKCFSLNRQNYSMQTVLAQTLSNMMIEDEDDLSIEVKNDFTCNADINYLSMVIKNLIDNAFKYKSKGHVCVVVDDGKIEVKNYSQPLSEKLEFYTREFTQEDNSRGTQGYGLGLNLVSRILKYHNFKLTHRYEKGQNVFGIDFNINLDKITYIND